MNKSMPSAATSLAESSVDTEEELQARVAWHYYIGNLTQQEIAQLIGSNRRESRIGDGADHHQ
jgi:DNA-binding transcriptional regulator LsrR (DeoR family)